MSKTIIVTISKDGEATVDPKGFHGKSCLQETLALEEALGKVTRRDPKPEMNEKVTDNVKVGG